MLKMGEDFTTDFSNADLKDVRRTPRLAKVVTAMANAPLQNISAACGGWGDTKAAYRLLNCKDVTPAALLAPHAKCVADRCAGHACVAVSQDTTELDYSYLKKTKGLGPLNEDYRRGFYMHSLYVVSEGGLPLGLLDVETIVRDDETFRTSAERKHLPIEMKESFRWVKGYRKTLELARSLPDCEVFSISDCEGDIFEVFDAWQLS
jgi:Transposase DNA-binding